MSIYKKYGIYGIRNKTNGKIYIGKTVNSFGDRWDCHKAQLRGRYHSNKFLQEDWDKYGEDNFELIIIHDCLNEETLDIVNQIEIEEIEKYKNLGLAYNVCEGGDTGLHGQHLSEETKRKIGEKNRLNMLGKKASDETKSKMSISQKKRYENWTDEDRKAYGEKISKQMKGIKKPSLKTIMKNNKNSAKYTVDQVREIRRLREHENKSYNEISAITGIPMGTISLIATYKRWKEIV